MACIWCRKPGVIESDIGNVGNEAHDEVASIVSSGGVNSTVGDDGSDRGVGGPQHSCSHILTH